jgi:aldose 1-epimerase
MRVAEPRRQLQLIDFWREPQYVPHASAVPATQLIHLRAGDWHAELSAAVGGSVARFWCEWRDGARNGRVDWLRPATDGGLAGCDPLSMASFPLLPFCNRIRNGRASFEGRDIRLPPNNPAQLSPHPLHGIGWQRPWKVITAQQSHASLALDVPATDAWPWHFSAQQQFTLDERQLTVMMTLTNLDGEAAMPAGLGHHPYFPHTTGTKLTSAVAAMWKSDDEVMPTVLQRTPEVERLRDGVVLSELDLDNNFTGWEHSAFVEWPADAQGPRRSITLQAQPPLDYFVLYCPAGADHFCAEPVSQCTDWLNLRPEYGQAAVGGTRLAAGESLQASFTLAPCWL